MRLYDPVIGRSAGLFLSAALLLTACAPQKPVTAELAPRTLKAVNLEETVSLRDEVMLAYSLTSYDAAGKPVAVVNGAWGVQPIKKGEQLTLTNAAPIQLPLPRNGRVVASLVLIEVDDYAQAQQTLAQVRKVHNLVSAPAALLLTATELLTPLKYVTAGLAAAGVGFQLVDRLDNDDLLGQSSSELREADVRRTGQTSLRVPARFSGQNLRDSFEYELVYDLVLKSFKIQSRRQ